MGWINCWSVASRMMSRYPRQLNILNRVTERPMPQVVQQRGDDQQLRIVCINPFGKLRIVGESFEIEQCKPIDTQRMFKPGVIGRRVD